MEETENFLEKQEKRKIFRLSEVLEGLVYIGCWIIYKRYIICPN